MTGLRRGGYGDVVATEQRHGANGVSLTGYRVAVLDSVILAIACRLADTIVGVVTGVAAAWLGLRLAGPRAEASQ